jgi:endonuclease YncB( thermonuclease family)
VVQHSTINGRAVARSPILGPRLGAFPVFGGCAVADYPAELIRIIDGDTQIFRCTLGLDVDRTERVRLAGLNCPELSTPEGVAAKLWVQNWFVAHPAPYVLSTVHDKRDNYGRLLGTVTAEDGTNLNAEILADGIGRIYRIQHHELPLFGLTG